MRTKEEIEKLINEVFPNDSASKKEKLSQLLSPENRLNILKDTISIQENMLDITEPLARHGKKFKGGERGQGKKAQEWKNRLSDIARGLESNKLNLDNILKRIENAINDNSIFWEQVHREDELVFFECSDGRLDSRSFKTINNEISNIRKKTHHKVK
jgi:hypothetical protein